MWFGVWGFEFVVLILRVGVWGLGSEHGCLGFGIWGFGFGVPDQGLGLQVWGFRLGLWVAANPWSPGFGSRALRFGFRFLYSGFRLGVRASGCEPLVSGWGIGFWVSGFGFRFLDFEFRASGCGFQFFGSSGCEPRAPLGFHGRLEARTGSIC